ncbi:hypothetical protein BU25DRAFT_26384 [Macroventuria anomochaeta]|uniref:Uncharacterized protein n=1 Tax=Macroventuria anomochaeta TaxID=301207 RepID=A0ACB6S516_9PLEO|nr:uncharacterized protein BU25DRAFT_26384 [Macroventuria anomochaeta]KAF2629072.1 hypothetical protein BU25DRAFT_26384 [Macroventuria anomochaeta]
MMLVMEGTTHASSGPVARKMLAAAPLSLTRFISVNFTTMPLEQMDESLLLNTVVIFYELSTTDLSSPPKVMDPSRGWPAHPAPQ